MLKRDDWIDLARNLDWDLSYVEEKDFFPSDLCGLGANRSAFFSFEEPYKTTYSEYVQNQQKKTEAIESLRKALANQNTYDKLKKPWLSALKLYAGAFSLAEFAAVVSNLRATRFAPHSAWRATANMGAVDEYRHTEIPLFVMHDFLHMDCQFDWAHRFYHTNNWVAIAARHLVDELLIGSNIIEFALATHFVFETGFTNLQFIGLSSMADRAGDDLFEEMIKSIQTDEARHAQIGPAVLEIVAKEDPNYAQRILDKWFWRSWRLFAVVTGFSMDYFAPLEARQMSFKEFMQEWVLGQYLRSLERFGLKKPWYFDIFLDELDYYHHMVYASAYTYRSTTWFDYVVPSPKEKEWLHQKYESFKEMEPVWTQIESTWRKTDPGVDFGVHGTSIIGFCDMCQMVLSAGTPKHNEARTFLYKDKKYIFCSTPCQWIFENEPERYGDHKDVVKRVLSGEAPGNLVAILTEYFGLDFENWGKDLSAGVYPWIKREAKMGDPK